ncbi:MAG: esterase, partial [Pirellulaceae bacterium]|nr:esterase [Pirellulaceae bacterium]
MPWFTHTVAGHPVDVYLPPRRNVHGDVLIYLHGLRQNRLSDKQPFLDEFDKHGLAVVIPWTKRSWWTDRICREFDASISAQRHLLENVVPFVQLELGVAPPRSPLL